MTLDFRNVFLSVSVLGILLCLPATALAQTEGHAQAVPPQSAKHPEETAAVDLAVVYTFDVWGDAQGGIRRGWRYLDNLDVTLAVDAERAIGWRGATLFFYGLYNNGQGFSDKLVGDAQGVSNIETGMRAARVYEAWVEQRVGHASIKLGLYDLNSEFDTSDTGSLFLNSSHGIGSDFSQSGRNGPSIFPVTSLALRADYRVDDQWLMRLAVLDGVPGDPDHPRRTAIKLSSEDGALVIGEVEYRTADTKAILGYWHYTASFTPFDAALSGKRPGNDGLYMMVEQRLSRAGTDGAHGLSGWVRLGLANDRFNPIDQHLSGGLVYTGPTAGRPEDQFGIAVSLAQFGEPYRAAVAAAGAPSTGSEVNIEASYRAVLTPWLTVQPDVQYVVNPGGDPGLGDALVIGLRTELSF